MNGLGMLHLADNDRLRVRKKTHPHTNVDNTTYNSTYSRSHIRSKNTIEQYQRHTHTHSHTTQHPMQLARSKHQSFASAAPHTRCWNDSGVADPFDQDERHSAGYTTRYTAIQSPVYRRHSDHVKARPWEIICFCRLAPYTTYSSSPLFIWVIYTIQTRHSITLICSKDWVGAL